LPHFRDYFYAAQSKPLTNPKYHARWKDIELSIINDPPIQAILTHKYLGRFIDKVQNPWIKVQLKKWNMIREEYKQDHKLQIIQWCAYDPEFKPNRMDHTFIEVLGHKRKNNILFPYRKRTLLKILKAY